MNRSKLDNLKASELQKKAAAKIAQRAKQAEIQLHPLQWDQNLDRLKDQKEANQIMRDFSISSLRQESILRMQEEDFDQKVAEDLQHGKILTLKNERLKSCLLEFATDKSIR